MYDHFNSKRAAIKRHRRARTVKHFILTGDLSRTKCACCGNALNDFSGVDTHGNAMHPEGYRNNRAEYRPATKSVVAMHYTCAWGKVLDKVVQLRAA